MAITVDYHHALSSGLSCHRKASVSHVVQVLPSGGGYVVVDAF
jgi:hypothetical protein